jgi:catechol 2,3-dioxygenase-like lactoylglutathione lyase family enzyme
VTAPSPDRVSALEAPKIASVSHLLLEVDDLERAVDFYVGFLGFEIRERDTLGDGRPFAATVQGLGLVGRRSTAGTPSFDHLAFRCPAGIEPLIEKLTSRGIAYEGPRRTPYGLSVYFRDPDGYRIECHDNTGVGGAG